LQNVQNKGSKKKKKQKKKKERTHDVAQLYHTNTNKTKRKKDDLEKCTCQTSQVSQKRPFSYLVGSSIVSIGFPSIHFEGYWKGLE